MCTSCMVTITGTSRDAALLIHIIGVGTTLDRSCCCQQNFNRAEGGLL